MKLEYPDALNKALKENPNLEVLVVATTFDKSKPLTKKMKKLLANEVYQAALAQLERFKP